MAEEIRILMAGVSGRTGRVVAAGLDTYSNGLTLVGGVGKRSAGRDLGELLRGSPDGRIIYGELAQALEKLQPDVLVDFTTAEVAVENVCMAAREGVRPVVGTTGFDEKQMNRIISAVESAGIGGAVIPNFSLGAMLLMRFCEEAIRFFRRVEIIELHHEGKKDAPSGTAKLIASRMNLTEVPVHSVRLPGLVAHHEVIFGGTGQTLTLRHDSISRESFVEGVALTVQKVMNLDRLIFRLDDAVMGA